MTKSQRGGENAEDELERHGFHTITKRKRYHMLPNAQKEHFQWYLGLTRPLA
jgi:hypothetical protein